MHDEKRAVTDLASVADAYRRIDDRGKERFDSIEFRDLYRHFFDREVSEDELDEQLIAYAACDRARTLKEFLLHLEYLDTQRDDTERDRKW